MEGSSRVLVLVLGILAIGNVVSSDIVRSTRIFLFPEPIPCHVYLKVKHKVETFPWYLPNSFFQVKVEFLRIEPDIISIQAKKDFMQAQLEKYEEQQKPPNRDYFAEKFKKALETIDDDNKAVILHVVETLEGTVPNEEIVFSLGVRTMSLRRAQLMIKTNARRYLLGYQRNDGRITTASVDINDLNEKDDWFLTDIKRWVRWLFSECDTV